VKLQLCLDACTLFFFSSQFCHDTRAFLFLQSESMQSLVELFTRSSPAASVVLVMFCDSEGCSSSMSLDSNRI
jgi:hypothetical protein